MSLLEPQLTPLSARDRLVLCGIGLVDTAGQDAAFLVEVEAEEEGHRVSVLFPVSQSYVPHGAWDWAAGKWNIRLEVRERDEAAGSERG